MHLLPLQILLFVALASPAFAADGVLEINQTCAVQTGCVAGDGAGFPIVIEGVAGRSDRLTSDLVLPDADTRAIRIFADHVTVDLAGFEIRGPVACGGDPVSCTPNLGFGPGISASIPNVFPILLTLGVMGYAGLPLDSFTLSSMQNLVNFGLLTTFTIGTALVSEVFLGTALLSIAEKLGALRDRRAGTTRT